MLFRHLFLFALMFTLLMEVSLTAEKDRLKSNQLSLEIKSFKAENGFYIQSKLINISGKTVSLFWWKHPEYLNLPSLEILNKCKKHIKIEENHRTIKPVTAVEGMKILKAGENIEFPKVWIYSTDNGYSVGWKIVNYFFEKSSLSCIQAKMKMSFEKKSYKESKTGSVVLIENAWTGKVDSMTNLIP